MNLYFDPAGLAASAFSYFLSFRFFSSEIINRSQTYKELEDKGVIEGTLKRLRRIRRHAPFVSLQAAIMRIYIYGSYVLI